MSTFKGIPLSKEEVMELLTLVEAYPVVNNRSTSATNNHLKDVAWNKITDNFNAIISSGPRKPEQLRLKWENLKKNARKRCTKIDRTRNSSSDIILDRVSSILCSIKEDCTVAFGGDLVEAVEVSRDSVDFKTDMIVTPGGDSEAKPFEGIGETSSSASKASDSEGGNIQPAATPTAQRKFFFTSNKNSVIQRKEKLRHEDFQSRIRRNNAIAEYAMAKKLESISNREKIQLQIEILKLKKARLKLSNNGNLGN